jgi:hypothetical protein
VLLVRNVECRLEQAERSGAGEHSHHRIVRAPVVDAVLGAFQAVGPVDESVDVQSEVQARAVYQQEGQSDPRQQRQTLQAGRRDKPTFLHAVSRPDLSGMLRIPVIVNAPSLHGAARVCRTTWISATRMRPDGDGVQFFDVMAALAAAKGRLPSRCPVLRLH